MAIIHKSAVVPYTHVQMFDLVNDVKKYSQFVPYCITSQIVQPSTAEEVHAALTFSGGGVHKSFTTLNRLQPHKLIEMRLVNGPFKHLEGFWSFKPVANDMHCEVTLNLEFEFSTSILRLLFGPIFNQVASKLVDAFQKRAELVYK